MVWKKVNFDIFIRNKLLGEIVGWVKSFGFWVRFIFFGDLESFEFRLYGCRNFMCWVYFDGVGDFSMSIFLYF